MPSNKELLKSNSELKKRVSQLEEELEYEQEHLTEEIKQLEIKLSEARLAKQVAIDLSNGLSEKLICEKAKCRRFKNALIGAIEDNEVEIVPVLSDDPTLIEIVRVAKYHGFDVSFDFRGEDSDSSFAMAR